VVQIVLWYLDSGCSKHMTGNRSQLINFVSKFLGTVRFGNDHIAKIMGYGDYQMGNVTITRVYYVEGLCNNLFSVGTPSLTTIDQDAPSSRTSQTTQEMPPPVIPLGVNEADYDIEVVHIDDNPNVDFPFPKPSLKNPLLRPVSTRHQLLDESLLCSFDAFVKPNSYKEAWTESCWIEAIQEELNEFEHLEV
nr:integrase, catalytic region, zinc finger, CCHC-type, peptidase aspartic, catalytic [Tanacetum cinerariifolium]